MTGAAGWATLFLLGAYHGINPGMGWLFAVALGMQEHSTRAVVRSLVPITLGHALAIGVVVLLADLIQVVLPLNYVKLVVALLLVALGVYRVLRSRHRAWAGMQVGFLELTAWSFLMASAHGAGLMVLPVVLQMETLQMATMHHSYGAGMTGVGATLVHTLGYLSVTAVVAIVVYQKAGLAILRKAWFNLDLVWAVALIATGCVALLV
jgi:hypothetical protein